MDPELLRQPTRTKLHDPVQGEGKRDKLGGPLHVSASDGKRYTDLQVDACTGGGGSGAALGVNE